MVDLFIRTGSTKLEDCACLRAVHDHGLRYRIALWTQRGRLRLLGGADVVPHSPYFVVHTRNSDFAPGHTAGGEPPGGLRSAGWRGRVCSAADVRPVLFSFAPISAGKQRSFRYILRGALVCCGAEIAVPGSPERIE